MSGNDFSYTPERLRELARDVLQYAETAGATACEVDVSEGFGQSVTVRKQAVETIEYNRDKGIGVSVYVGQRRGHASTSDFSSAALRATVDAALSIAKFTAEDPCAGLPDEKLLASRTMDLDLYHPWALEVEEAIEIARRCEQAAFDVSPLIKNSEGASVSVQQSHFISANSIGFMGGFPSTRHYIACAVIAGKRGDMQRDDWYSTHRDSALLSAPEAIGDYAARRALSRLKARKIKTRQAPVLFEATLAPTIIGSLVAAVSGGALYRKSSFLLDSLGKQVLPKFMQIDERPHIKGALGSSPFDDDGVMTKDRSIVKDGILQGYFLFGQDFSEDRSTEMHCHFANYDKTLLPGMYMNAEIQLHSQKSNALPSDAIVSYENKSYVFIAKGSKQFEMKEVEIGNTENGFTEISSNDLKNKNIVIKGAYALLMKMKNSEEE